MSNDQRRRGRMGGVLPAICLLVLAGCVPLNPTGAVDSDGDGLSDARERAIGTDPEVADTDQDGALDGDELSAGTSPLAPDSDHDGTGDGDDPTVDPPSRMRGSNSTGNDVEPNNSFDQSVNFSVTGSGTLTIEGQIDLPRDADVFDLGPLEPGDRIRVDFYRVDEGFTPSASIFDEQEDLFYVAEDLYGVGGPDLKSFISETVRHGSEHYYFAVATRMAEQTLGLYKFDITIERGEAVVEPAPQTIFMDFDGGSPDRPLLDVSVVAPFDAGKISPAYEGQDDLIKEGIIETFLQNFDGFDIAILTSDEVPAGPTGDCTTILFGSFHDSAFGVSVGVDPYNQNRCDDGIIFTEAFTSLVFGFTPPARDIAVAIGNVAAHEAGHLLGLNHVAEVTALMDEASPAYHLLADQEFKIAPLSESVFPFGWQNAPSLLTEIVGER